MLEGGGRRASKGRVDACKTNIPQRLHQYGVDRTPRGAGGMDVTRIGGTTARRADAFRSRFLWQTPKHEAPLEQGMGLVDMPFDIKNVSIENGEAEKHPPRLAGGVPLPECVPHGFSAIQSFVSRTRRMRASRIPGVPARSDRGPARILDVPQKVAQEQFWDSQGGIRFLPESTPAGSRNVVELVTEKAGWGQARVPRSCHGLEYRRPQQAP